jgi:cytochrome c-type biogenesis protein
MAHENITLAVAVLAGFFTFLSPCVFPLIPFYIFYITGITAKEKETLSDSKVRARVAFHALFFVLGFSFIFVVLGVSFSFLGRFFYEYSEIVRRVAGIAIIIFGLGVAGLFHIDFARTAGKIKFSNKKWGLLGSFVIGTAFGFSWTPCAGPILGSILGLASTQETVSKGVILLAGYSFGLAVPFFVSAILFEYFLVYSKLIKKYTRPIQIVSGVFLVIIGILVFGDFFNKVSSLLMGR